MGGLKHCGVPTALLVLMILDGRNMAKPEDTATTRSAATRRTLQSSLRASAGSLSVATDGPSAAACYCRIRPL